MNPAVERLPAQALDFSNGAASPTGGGGSALYRGQSEISAGRAGEGALRSVSRPGDRFGIPAPVTHVLLPTNWPNGTAPPEHPFGLQIQPGVGTFENYVEFGAARVGGARGCAV